MVVQSAAAEVVHKRLPPDVLRLIFIQREKLRRACRKDKLILKTVRFDRRTRSRVEKFVVLRVRKSGLKDPVYEIRRSAGPGCRYQTLFRVPAAAGRLGHGHIRRLVEELGTHQALTGVAVCDDEKMCRLEYGTMPGWRRRKGAPGPDEYVYRFVRIWLQKMDVPMGLDVAAHDVLRRSDFSKTVRVSFS